jgi:hypothetical protein
LNKCYFSQVGASVVLTLSIIDTCSLRCDATTILQPFVDTEVPVHAYFPDRYYAIAVPSVLLVLLLAFIGTFVSITIIKSSASKKSS